MRLDWGDVPTWLQGVSALLALVLTAAAAYAAYRVYQIESSRDAVSEAERRRIDEMVRRAQAGLVAGWNSNGGLVLANRSQLPVYKVVASLALVGDGEPRLVPARGERRWRHTADVLPPGEQVIALSTAGAARSGQDFGLEVVFQDSNGQYWRRSASGQLEELSTSGTDYYHLD